MRKLKRWLIVILLMIAAFVIYVEIVNRNTKSMTYRQKVLKAVYPVLMWWSKLNGKHRAGISGQIAPPVSFYSLRSVLNKGEPFDFAVLRGKKVLLVNTASDCGYTDQYRDLQDLSEQFRDRLVVLAFPANDFKEQEKGSDAEIEKFCRENYGISFPLMQKTTVIRSPQQHEVYQWLTDSAKNGWNTRAPSWNFSKYIVNEEGRLTHYFGPSTSPLSRELLEALQLAGTGSQ